MNRMNYCPVAFHIKRYAYFMVLGTYMQANKRSPHLVLMGGIPTGLLHTLCPAKITPHAFALQEAQFIRLNIKFV